MSGPGAVADGERADGGEVGDGQDRVPGDDVPRDVVLMREVRGVERGLVYQRPRAGVAVERSPNPGGRRRPGGTALFPPAGQTRRCILRRGPSGSMR